MSGPVLQGDVAGAINSFGIGERPEINGSLASFRLDFPIVNDEAVFEILIAGKLTGKTVACPGRNAATTKVCQRAEPLKPKAR